jgi:hypothetical protein
VYADCFDNPRSRGVFNGGGVAADLLSSIPVPTISVWSDYDYVVPPFTAMVDWAHGQMRGGTFDCERMKQLAARYLHVDQVICELRAAVIHYRCWSDQSYTPGCRLPRVDESS